MRNEARVGIEPTYRGFADPCLTTWLPRLIKKTTADYKSAKIKLSNKTSFAWHAPCFYKPRIKILAEARFVASGTSCTSAKRSSIKISGSWG